MRANDDYPEKNITAVILYEVKRGFIRLVDCDQTVKMANWHTLCQNIAATLNKTPNKLRCSSLMITKAS